MVVRHLLVLAVHPWCRAAASRAWIDALTHWRPNRALRAPASACFSSGARVGSSVRRLILAICFERSNLREAEGDCAAQVIGPISGNDFQPTWLPASLCPGMPRATARGRVRGVSGNEYVDFILGSVGPC